MHLALLDFDSQVLFLYFLLKKENRSFPFTVTFLKNMRKQSTNASLDNYLTLSSSDLEKE